MENVILLIGGVLLFFFLLYVVLETAVRRGIDCSETSEMVKELLEIHRNQSNK